MQDERDVLGWELLPLCDEGVAHIVRCTPDMRRRLLNRRREVVQVRIDVEHLLRLGARIDQRQLVVEVALDLSVVFAQREPRLFARVADLEPAHRGLVLAAGEVEARFPGGAAIDLARLGRLGDA